MTKSDRPKRSLGSIALFAIMFAALLMPVSSGAARADEIPHENYDLMGDDLDFVIAMLNSSIRYSELALMCMYNQTMPLAEQNLSVVRNMLVPAERLLSDIEDVAGSYDDLKTLIPPFAGLSTLMDGFALDEVALLQKRAELVSTSTLLNLTGDQLVAALDVIKRFNELIVKMNATIDDMLVSAHEITDLQVGNKTPFADNQLVPLIERLRELLVRLEYEMQSIIEEEIPWGESEPFLILWISSADYYLGDTIIGGGYLFYNGAFAVGNDVRILFDGALLITAVTSLGGRFSFAYQIPLDASWVGTHTMFANCTTPIGILTSDVLTVTISFIPTVITLDLSTSEMSILESVSASVVLTDFRGNPIESDACHFTVDGDEVAFDTDSEGTASHTWQASQLGYGRHAFEAFYEGEVPYAPDSSGPRQVVIDIPTALDLRLFLTEIRSGQYVVGNGTLYANDTERLANQKITLFLDDVIVANLTTDGNGEFAFSIDSGSLTLGGHTLRAAFVERDVVWSYCQDVESFTVKWYKTGEYPFWPVIPGWGGGGGDLIPYLFIGRNAYFFWLLLLAFAGVAIRVLQMRKHAVVLAARKRSEELEPIDSALRASGSIAPPLDEPFEIPLPTEVPANPNERIVWYYQRLLAFLMKRGWAGLRTSMTHREVERILKSWGYPRGPVEDATMLFERALYSGADMTDEDAVQMSAAMTSLARPATKGAADAV
ncbi:MAG: DUF4129 domain-containing protein [Candidatus Thermoplasmatota archaeon]|nr:DUF4129 domain-containing protein [Candidatus Thermoplasmatota archaeon]